MIIFLLKGHNTQKKVNQGDRKIAIILGKINGYSKNDNVFLMKADSKYIKYQTQLEWSTLLLSILSER